MTGHERISMRRFFAPRALVAIRGDGAALSAVIDELRRAGQTSPEHG